MSKLMKRGLRVSAFITMLGALIHGGLMVRDLQDRLTDAESDINYLWRQR